MASTANNVTETLAVVDSAMTILNKYPSLDKVTDDLSLNFDYSTSISPISLLIQLLKHTRGYDYLIKILAKYIAYAMPALELTVKGIILSNIKTIISCSANPFIPYDILLNGIVLDLKKIDVLNILEYNPFISKTKVSGFFSEQELGRYYYFGCDCLDRVSDLQNVCDFNAFLWYVKNKAVGRSTWFGVDLLNSTISDSGTQTQGLFSTNVDCNKVPKQKEWTSYDSWTWNQDTDKIPKSKLSDGIVTLVYHERSNALSDAEGNKLSITEQIPTENCLQVFLGNTQPLRNSENEYFKLKSEYLKLENTYSDYENKLYELGNKQIRLTNKLTNLAEKIKSGSDNTGVETDSQKQDEIKQKYDKIKAELDKVNGQIEIVSKNKNICYEALGKLKGKISENYSPTELKFKPVYLNYYYGKTIFEFNTEFVTHMKLYDSKTVTAQLIDALTGCLTIDLNISGDYNRSVLKKEIEKIINNTIENDDATITDCFFTFDNKEYDNLLKKTELMKAGLYSFNGEQNGTSKVDAASLLSNLDGITDGATKEETQTIIEHCFTKISEELRENGDNGVQESSNFNASAAINNNFIENLLTQLSYVITTGIMSPKVYVLLALNMKLMEREQQFDPAAFIEQNRTMFAQIIKEVVDHLIGFITNEVYMIVGQLAAEVGSQLTKERIKYYRDLIRKMINCFNGNGDYKNYSFDIPNINYADIYEENQELEPTEDNC